MAITVTIRANGERTEVRGLPLGRTPRSNYAILENAIGASRRGQVQYRDGAFRVSRAHTSQLINELAVRFGSIRVVQHGGVTLCVERCWNASPDTSWDCECSCAGGNHGTGRPIGAIVSTGDSTTGALSAAPNEPRVFWVHQ